MSSEKTHEQVWEYIQSLSNEERIKLLEKLYRKYFDSRPPREVIEREKIRDMWGED